jgi:hypothetical protein
MRWPRRRVLELKLAGFSYREVMELASSALVKRHVLIDDTANL